MRIDSDGDQTFEKRFTIPWHGLLPGWSNCCDTLPGGGFVVGGTLQDTSQNLTIDLIAFDQLGDTIWTRTYDPAGENWAPDQVKRRPNGGCALVGTKSVVNTSEAFLLATDAAGNEQLRRSYLVGSASEISDVVPLNEGGYLLSGVVITGDADLWLMRVDSTGDPVWPQKVWGGPFDEAGAKCILASDGEIVVAGDWAYANDYDAMRPYLAKVDINTGSTLWDRVYGPERSTTTAFTVKECPNTDLIISGATTDEDEHYIGFLLHTMANGDSIWMRDYYYADTLFTNGQGRLHDVLPTPDGGFIATGAAYNPATSGYPPGYSQDVWVIKVDSMGCIVPGCDGLTGITEQVTNLGDALTLYPNPVHEQLHVGIKLPTNFATTGPLTLSVTTMEGKLVLQQQVHSSPSPREKGPGDEVLDVSSLAAGMYSLHLSDAQRWLGGKKFVVE